VRALAQALGIGLFDTYDSGDNVYLNNGQRSTFSDSSPTGSAPLDPVILPDLTTAVTQLDEMAAEIPVDAPWTAAKATQYDSQTLQSWAEANSVTPQFRQLTTTACQPIFGAESRELSLLYVLFYIASRATRPIKARSSATSTPARGRSSGASRAARSSSRSRSRPTWASRWC
jgi:monoamine oxidase